MCRTGGRRCPAHSNPMRVAEYNAVRREREAAKKGKELSNAQYKHRVTYANEKVAELVDKGFETHNQYAYTDPSGNLFWDKERAIQHDEIVRDLLTEWDNVPTDGKALFTGGLGGAGKTTVLSEYAGVDLSTFATINPDDIKEILAEKGLIPEVPGLSPMEASPLVHEEASHISKMVARELLRQKKNVIYDVTMTSYDSTIKKVDELKDNGYHNIDVVFVDIPAEVSIRRAEGRHRAGINNLVVNKKGYGGRLLPVDIMKKQAAAQPLNILKKIVNEGIFQNWEVWDNSVDGRAPIKKDIDISV